MKVNSVEITKKEMVKKFLKDLGDDEVMTSPELAKHIPMPRSSASGALSGAAADLGMESYVVGRKRYYGTKKAIKKLRDRIEGQRN